MVLFSLSKHMDLEQRRYTVQDPYVFAIIALSIQLSVCSFT